MGTLTLITNGLQSAGKASYWNSAVSITLIICVTVFLITVAVFLLMYFKNRLRLNSIKDKELAEKAYNLKLKESQGKGGEQPTETSSPVTQPSAANTDNKNEKNLKRKQDYQDRLIGFMEKRAIKKETTTKDGTTNETSREYDATLSEAFIKKMEELINELGS